MFFLKKLVSIRKKRNHFLQNKPIFKKIASCFCKNMTICQEIVSIMKKGGDCNTDCSRHRVDS